MTEDVRERQFEVAQKGTRTTSLTTGYLATCFAVYGWNRDKGIAFLWHLDAHAFGMGGIARRVRIAAGGDLSGFDLQMTSGWGLRGRILATLIVETLAIKWAINTDTWLYRLFPLVIAVAGFYFILGNWLVASWYIRRTFGERIRFRHIPFCVWIRHKKLLPRVAVTVHVDRAPLEPSIEASDAALASEERFGPTRDSRSCERPVRVTTAKKKNSLVQLKRKKYLHWCVIAQYAVIVAWILLIAGSVIWPRAWAPSIHH